jgi:hypothetical protein
MEVKLIKPTMKRSTFNLKGKTCNEILDELNEKFPRHFTANPKFDIKMNAGRVRRNSPNFASGEKRKKYAEAKFDRLIPSPGALRSLITRNKAVRTLPLAIGRTTPLCAR